MSSGRSRPIDGIRDALRENSRAPNVATNASQLAALRGLSPPCRVLLRINHSLIGVEKARLTPLHDCFRQHGTRRKRKPSLARSVGRERPAAVQEFQEAPDRQAELALRANGPYLPSRYRAEADCAYRERLQARPRAQRHCRDRATVPLRYGQGDQVWRDPLRANSSPSNRGSSQGMNSPRRNR